MLVFCDVEADNLLPYVKKIWCVSVLDSSGECVTYTERDAFVEASKSWTTIVMHNGLGYDLWVLLLLWGIPFTVGPDTFNGRPVKYVDTLVLSRYLWPDRPWGHSLEAWGEKLGMPKGQHSDWTQYSEEMAEYNRQDNRVTKAVYEFLSKEMK